jgi:uncharacterized protein YciI
MTGVPPIRREVEVPADTITAFEVFTADIGKWWPLHELSVFGAGATVAFTDGKIVERSPEGETTLWGTVTRWEPDRAIAFTWHPGKTSDRASQVLVTFTARETNTLVTLEHTGWDAFDDPTGARSEYDKGWPTVLSRYEDQVEQQSENGAETWVALMHRPGPSAPQGQSLFEDPRFAEHVAFLGRMQKAGYLVAAGPLVDRPGEGMTILRLPGASQIELATYLANEDDTSVAQGFFTVSVRPWNVLLQG